MSPLRYVRDGFRIVRVTAPPPPEAPALPVGEEALVLADAADDYATRLHRWAAGIRRDAARHAPLRDVEPGSDVTRDDVRRAREVAGLTQKELAARLHFGRQHLSDMENGRRRVSYSVGEWAKRELTKADPEAEEKEP